MKNRCKRFVKEWVLPFVYIFAIITPLKSAVLDWNHVPTGSMKPTILVGDNLLINKLAYDLKIPFTTCHLAKWGNPERGDIVVFFDPAKDIRMVKRVIGLPGDTIELVDNKLTINGKPISYKAAGMNPLPEQEKNVAQVKTENLCGKAHLMMELPDRFAFRTFPKVTVPAGKYFVMGDNRDNSMDSRFFGFVERKRIVGRAERVIYSKPSWAIELPKILRTFKKLI